MWAKDKGRVKDDLRQDELDPKVYISTVQTRDEHNRVEKKSGYKSYESFWPRNCFVNSHVNSMRIR